MTCISEVVDSPCFNRISAPESSQSQPRDSLRMETSSQSLRLPHLPHRSSATVSYYTQRTLNSPDECDAAYRRLLERVLGHGSPPLAPLTLNERPVGRGRDSGSLVGLSPLPPISHTPRPEPTARTNQLHEESDFDPLLDDPDLRPSPESPTRPSPAKSSWPSLITIQ
jgi:hypothetical protein